MWRAGCPALLRTGVAFQFPLGSSVLLWLSASSRMFCIGVVVSFQGPLHWCGCLLPPGTSALCGFLLPSWVLCADVAFCFLQGVLHWCGCFLSGSSALVWLSASLHGPLHWCGCLLPGSSALVWLSASSRGIVWLSTSLLGPQCWCGFLLSPGCSALVWFSTSSRIFHTCVAFSTPPPPPGSLHGCAFLLSSRVIYTGVAFDFSSGSTTLVYWCGFWLSAGSTLVWLSFSPRGPLLSCTSVLVCFPLGSSTLVWLFSFPQDPFLHWCGFLVLPGSSTPVWHSASSASAPHCYGCLFCTGSLALMWLLTSSAVLCTDVASTFVQGSLHGFDCFDSLKGLYSGLRWCNFLLLLGFAALVQLPHTSLLGSITAPHWCNFPYFLGTSSALW